MNRMSDIQHRVDETLAILDNVRQANPKPFFYTRLEARLRQNRSNIWERVSVAVSRPAIAMTTLLLVLIMNILVIVTGTTALDNISELPELSSTEDLRSATAYYDIENNEP